MQPYSPAQLYLRSGLRSVILYKELSNAHKRASIYLDVKRVDEQHLKKEPIFARIRTVGGDSEALLETAACLYQSQARYDLTLAILLRLRRDRVFDFICNHHLMPLLKGHAVTQLLSIDPQRAERLLVDFHEEAPPGVVVPAIQVLLVSPPSRAQSHDRRANGSLLVNLRARVSCCKAQP